MDWKELKLDKPTLRALREEYGIETPEQVLRLAWGAPDLIERVVPPEILKRLREAFPVPDGGEYDSSQFAMGSRFGVPLSSMFENSDEFEKIRAALIEKLEREKSPLRRAALELQLQKLYERL